RQFAHAIQRGAMQERAAKEEGAVTARRADVCAFEGRRRRADVRRRRFAMTFQIGGERLVVPLPPRRVDALEPCGPLAKERRAAEIAIAQEMDQCDLLGVIRIYMRNALWNRQ